MVALTWDDVASLRDDMGERRVSIYTPVHRTGREIEQDPLRLRNLLDEAAGELEAAGVRTPEIAALLQPARDLITDPPNWSHQNAGLALFIKPEQMRTFELPFAAPELAVAGGRFHLRPLPEEVSLLLMRQGGHEQYLQMLYRV